MGRWVVRYSNGLVVKGLVVKGLVVKQSKLAETEVLGAAAVVVVVVESRSPQRK